MLEDACCEDAPLPPSQRRPQALRWALSDLARQPSVHPQFTLADGLTPASAPPHPPLPVCTSSSIRSSQLFPPLHVPGQLRPNRGPQFNSAFPLSLLFPITEVAPPPTQFSQAMNPGALLITISLSPALPLPHPPQTYCPLWPNHTTHSFPNCRLGSAARPLYKLRLLPGTHLPLLFCQRTASDISSSGSPP